MITTINTLKDIYQKNCIIAKKQKTLLLFDIDNVIIAPKDPILGPSGYDLGKILMKKYTNSKNRLYYFSTILQQAEFGLVENEIINLINNFKNLENFLVFGITKSKIGWNKYLNNSYENFKLNLLSKFGINFCNNNYLDASLLTSRKKIKHLKFIQGVIFANQLSKGNALECFFRYFNLKVNLIIIIDDELPNLRSIQKVAKKNGLQYQGYHFQAQTLYGNTINTSIAEQQFKNLVKTGHWLSERDTTFLSDIDSARSI